jgi:uncharacterized protein YndB with AHSA1/START domain
MGVSAELDPRPGGIFEVDPNGRDVISGEFLEVDAPHHLVFTWGWKETGHAIPAGSTRVAIDLTAHQGGTLLRLTHFGVSGSSRERHIAGWSHYLKRLELVAVSTDPGPDPYATLDTAHG